MCTVGSVHMHTHKHTYTCTQAHTIIMTVVVKLIFKSEIKINNKYSICIETVTDERIQEK